MPFVQTSDVGRRERKVSTPKRHRSFAWLPIRAFAPSWFNIPGGFQGTRNPTLRAIPIRRVRPSTENREESRLKNPERLLRELVALVALLLHLGRVHLLQGLEHFLGVLGVIGGAVLEQHRKCECGDQENGDPEERTKKTHGGEGAEVPVILKRWRGQPGFGRVAGLHVHVPVKVRERVNGDVGNQGERKERAREQGKFRDSHNTQPLDGIASQVKGLKEGMPGIPSPEPSDEYAKRSKRQHCDGEAPAGSSPPPRADDLL